MCGERMVLKPRVKPGPIALVRDSASGRRLVSGSQEEDAPCHVRRQRTSLTSALASEPVHLAGVQPPLPAAPLRGQLPSGDALPHGIRAYAELSSCLRNGQWEAIDHGHNTIAAKS